jgi:NADH dehydrogenase
VCLGGGWTAIYLARALERAVRNGLIDLTVVGRDNFHTLHGFIAEMLTGRIAPGQIASAARRMFPHAHFHNAEVEEIDVANKRIVTSRHLDGRQYVLTYDHLVVALGSIDDLSRFPGVAEHALKLKTYWDSFKVRNHILAMLELAEIETDPEERRRLLTFVVVGGGYGGIEVAAELQDFISVVAKKEYPRIRPEDARVIVVHGGARILPELVETQPKLVAYAERVLRERGVSFRLGRRVAAATTDEAVLDDGERIPTETIISSAGTALTPLLATLPFERDERGRIVTDQFLRVPGAENVWVGGDCAAVPHPSGGTCPQLAIFAMQHGRLIGENLHRQLVGKPLKSFKFRGLGDACGIGRRRAIAHLYGIRFYGTPAWLLWRTVFLFYVPTWDRRLRILLDWLITPVVGRDIVEMRVREPFGIRRVHYEPGHAIIRQGELSRVLYLIWEGEVRVVREQPDGRRTELARLGSGQHFGEIGVFRNSRRSATVEAVTKCELLAVGQYEARALSEVVDPFAAMATEKAATE